MYINTTSATSPHRSVEILPLFEWSFIYEIFIFAGFLLMALKPIAIPCCSGSWSWHPRTHSSFCIPCSRICLGRRRLTPKYCTQICITQILYCYYLAIFWQPHLEDSIPLLRWGKFLIIVIRGVKVIVVITRVPLSRFFFGP